MSESTCYYYDEQCHRCNCYVNENLDELLAENAKLHDELAKWKRLAAGIDLPEYPVTQFKPKDLERENANLRKQVRLVANLFSRVTSDLEDKNANLHTQVSKLKFKIYKWRAIAEAREQTIDRLGGENAKLRELVALMYRDMQGVLDMSTDTVWVDDIGTLRDEMDYHMQAMAELGMPPVDYERRMRELGVDE